MSESPEPRERDEDLGADEDLEVTEDLSAGVVGGGKKRSLDEEEPPVQT
jgi:hypothetical protein